MDKLSVSEKTAENMYNLLRIGKMGKHSFIDNFVNLAKREDNIGAFYLTWLLARSNNKYIKKLDRMHQYYLLFWLNSQNYQ